MSMSFLLSLVLTGLAALSLAACSTTGERLSGVGGREAELIERVIKGCGEAEPVKEGPASPRPKGSSGRPAAANRSGDRCLAWRPR